MAGRGVETPTQLALNDYLKPARGGVIRTVDPGETPDVSKTAPKSKNTRFHARLVIS